MIPTILSLFPLVKYGMIRWRNYYKINNKNNPVCARSYVKLFELFPIKHKSDRIQRRFAADHNAYNYILFFFSFDEVTVKDVSLLITTNPSMERPFGSPWRCCINDTIWNKIIIWN